MDEESEAAAELSEGAKRLKSWTEIEKARMLGTGLSVADPAGETVPEPLQGEGPGGGFA